MRPHRSKRDPLECDDENYTGHGRGAILTMIENEPILDVKIRFRVVVEEIVPEITMAI